MNLGNERHTLAKGFINGRDQSGRPVYGLFVAAASPTDLIYASEMFSYDQVDADASVEIIQSLLETSKTSEKTPQIVHYEKEFHQFMEISRLFQNTKGYLDAKDIERKISYFCSDTLGFSAITFLEMNEVASGELLAIFPFLLREDEKKKEVESGPSEGEDENGAKSGGAKDGVVFVACEPVLDPVSGIALNDLMIGDVIVCRLPEDSSFYKFFSGSRPEFDGILRGVITGIQLGEYGIATVAIELSEGISGALRISGKVRIKRLATVSNSSDDSKNASIEMLLAISSVVVFLSVMGVLLYKLS